jgi:FixJ family two-component response regulator
VIVCSGLGEQDVAPRFAGDGPVGFLQKPFSMGELVGKLRTALHA